MATVDEELAREAADRAASERAPLVNARLVAVDIPFGEMVWLLVKWTCAAIPAGLIVGLILLGVFFAVGGLALLTRH
jgi:hypothetical protein